MNVLKPYDQIFTTEKPYVFLKSGRLAGKTVAVSQFVVKKFFESEGDIVVFRSNYADIKKSVMQEILNVIVDMGLYDAVETRQKPLMIINQLNNNYMYFEGVGGADVHRTKGFKPHKSLSLVVGEELQQVPQHANLKEALATFVRYYQEDTKTVFMFNPPRIASHWVNEFYRIKEYDSDYLCLHTSYKDIAKMLNHQALREIEIEKKVNPSNYKHQFLGLTEGLFGAVYADFNRRKHLLNEDTIKKLLTHVGVHQLLVGIDPASTRDATALVPIVLLKNGQTVVLNYFYHDPSTFGHVNNEKLTPLIMKWLEEDVLERWKLNAMARIDLVFDTNAVSNDLRSQLGYKLPRNFYLQAYTQKNIIEMADYMRNALGKNAILILDEGGYYNYTSNQFMYGKNPLVEQLEQVVWDENGTQFERKIPNDCTDALTYGIAFYFRNPANLNFPQTGYFYKTPTIEEGELKL